MFPRSRSASVRLTISVVGLVTFGPVVAAGQDSAAIRLPPVPISSRTLAHVAPYVGLLAGSVLADHGIRAIMQAHRGPLGNDFASVGNSFGNPLLMVPALGLTFAAGKLAHSSDLAQAAWHAGRALVVAGVFTQALKISFGRARPAFSGNDIDVFTPFTLTDGRNSFPSGHSVVAFSIASALAEDVHGTWGRRLLYAGATVTAFARVNDDKHWLSDVVAGAMLGTFTAKWLARGHARIAPLPGGLGFTFDL